MPNLLKILFWGLFRQFQLSHITSAEQERAEFAEDAAGDSVPIAGIELILIEICAYHGGKSRRDAAVEHVIDGAYRELV